jgi:hypothetical protein
MSKQQQVILHPIMFALYPVAFLYTGHKNLFDFSVTFGPALVTVLFSAMVWLVISKITGDWRRAAVPTSALILVLFSYSAIQRILTSFGTDGTLDLWSKIIGACIVAVFAGTVIALRSAKNLGFVNYLMNVVSIFLVASPLFQLGLGSLGARSLQASLPDRTEFYANTLPKDVAPGPDIYYLVLDGYARQDALQEYFDYDNSEMIEALRQRDFAVADQAIANYPYTLVSVNSSLNFSYLGEILGDQLASSGDERYLRQLMQDSRAVRLLKQAGYRIVSFESEYWGANIGGVDVDIKEWWFVNHFNFGVLQMTPLPRLLQAMGYTSLFDLHRMRTEYPYDHMDQALDVAGPKFVYSHTFFGHPPFVFGPNGEKVSAGGKYRWEIDGSDETAKRDFVQGYRDQISYLNGRLLETIDQIRANSEREPIIIIHGDHGAGLLYDAGNLDATDVAERYNIFYAAHLPDGGNEDVYPTISPVNGLRIVFNRYLGTDYELLEDRAYFAAHGLPYAYTAVPGLQRPQHNAQHSDELTALTVDH